MNFLLILSILEACYVIYMMNYYKSKTNYSDPRIKFTNLFLAHPETNSEVPICMICPAGNLLGWLFGFFIFLKDYAFYLACNLKTNEQIIYKQAVKEITIPLIFMSIMMSALNFNALLYLSPIFVIETIKTLFIY